MRKNTKQRRFAKTSVMEQPLLLQRCRRSTTSLKKKRKLFAIRVVSGGSHIGESLLSRFGVCQEFSSAEFCIVQCRHPEDLLFSSSLREDSRSVSLQEVRDYWALETSCCCFRRFYLCCFAQLLEYMTSSLAQRQWMPAPSVAPCGIGPYSRSPVSISMLFAHLRPQPQWSIFAVILQPQKPGAQANMTYNCVQVRVQGKVCGGSSASCMLGTGCNFVKEAGWRCGVIQCPSLSYSFCCCCCLAA